MNVVLDVECFADDVIKEFAFATPFYCVGMSFRPPYSLSQCSIDERIQNDWCTNKLHKISWNSGQHFYDELTAIIKFVKSENAEYFAKGLQKCLMLTKLFGVRVQNLEDSGCPNFNQLDGHKAQINCDSYPSLHANVSHCAQKKASAYARWLSVHKLIEHDLESVHIVDTSD